METTEQTQELIRYYAFMYQKDGRFHYKELDSLSWNDGSRSLLSAVTFSKKLGAGSTGAIWKATVKSEGHISYASKQLPIAYWKNQEDVAAWTLVQAATDSEKKIISEGKVNQLVSVLKPLNEQYRKANYEQRRLMLAEIIRIVTG